MNVVLGPDIYANASVAPGTDPDKVVQRTLGAGHKVHATGWILDRVRDILARVPAFKQDALDGHMDRIRSLVQVVDTPEPFKAEDWAGALAAAAKAAKAQSVVTDHPDLLSVGQSGGVDFISSENFLFELAVPPPPPIDR